MVTERKYCTKCRTEEDLIKYNVFTAKNGNVTIYFMCRSCNAERKRRWYYNGNQKKALAINRRYEARKMGL